MTTPGRAVLQGDSAAQLYCLGTPTSWSGTTLGRARGVGSGGAVRERTGERGATERPRREDFT